MSHFSATEHTAISSAATVQLTDYERQPCEVWTRVMGYHRPAASFNTGNQREPAGRLFFSDQTRGGNTACGGATSRGAAGGRPDTARHLRFPRPPRGRFVLP